MECLVGLVETSAYRFQVPSNLQSFPLLRAPGNAHTLHCDALAETALVRL